MTIPMTALAFPGCPSCKKVEGQEHEPNCKYAGGGMPDQVRAKHAEQRDIFVKCQRALSLLDELHARHGTRLPSEYWRAKISLESILLSHSEAAKCAAGG